MSNCNHDWRIELVKRGYALLFESVCSKCRQRETPQIMNNVVDELRKHIAALKSRTCEECQHDGSCVVQLALLKTDIDTRAFCCNGWEPQDATGQYRAAAGCCMETNDD